MAFNLDNKISNLNDAQYPSPNKENANLVAPFGGEAIGFAKGVGALYSKNFYVNGAPADASTVAEGMSGKTIASSIGNKYALFNFQGFYGSLNQAQQENYIDSESNPLMGGVNAKQVSLPKIINYFEDKYPKIGYKPSDFLYSKYYKKIPVNHLVTLRRFPTPITDNIYTYNVRPKDSQDSVDATQVAGVTAITYLGETAGNKLEDLLSMSFGLNFKELTAEMEAVDTGGSGGGYTQQPFYNKIGGIGKAVADASKGVSSGAKFRAQNGAGSSTSDRLGTTYANFVLGPINVVDKTMIRDRGLKFSNDMKLTFEYELKSLSYINPKIAMIDIISNMLTMTTNNAQFFGGGHRYYGSAGFVGSQFGDINKLRGGDFSGYMGSVVNDVETGMKGLFGDADGNFDSNSIVDGLKNVGKTLLGNMLGGFLGSQVGGQTGTSATKAFISGEPTGDWHVTVGNPLNPIVMMGNMICDNAQMTLGAGLGYDDFPMEVKFELDLKHGKPRDKGDIENMFNAGQGRIYASAAGVEDVLNLSGKEVATYGSVPDAGTSNIQANSNAPSPASFNNEQIANVKADRSATGNIKNATSGEYVSNLTQMLIDS
jgi:hypothetical protein